MLLENYKSHFDSLFADSLEKIDHYSKRGYWIGKEIIHNSVLFIGLNPTYPHDDYKESSRTFYNEKDQKHSYFKQLISFYAPIYNVFKIQWTHYDLLVLRETKQSEIEKLSRTVLGKEFILKNLTLSKMILEESQPRAMVVANTFAKKLLSSSNWCGYSFNWDEQIGTYRFGDDSSLSGTPVLFTSMLSGQRALDVGSRERLQWQLKRTLHFDMVINPNTF